MSTKLNTLVHLLLHKRTYFLIIAILTIIFFPNQKSFSQKVQQIGQEIRLNGNNYLRQTRPRIAIAPSGDFVAVWESDHNGGNKIYGRLFDASSNPKGGDFEISSSSSRGKYLAVDIDSYGNFVVTWTTAPLRGTDDVYARIFSNDGIPQGDEFLVNTYTVSNQFFSDIAVDQEGNFVIIWESNNNMSLDDGQDGSGAGIYGQRYSSLGEKLGNEFRINTYTYGQQQRPKIAMSDNGEFIVTWISYGQNRGLAGIYGQRYNADGSAQGLEMLLSDLEPFYSANNGNVSMNNDGSYTVVWKECRENCQFQNVYGQMFKSNNEKLGAKFQVNDYVQSVTGTPEVTYYGSNNIFIAWSAIIEESYNVFGKYYNEESIAQGRSFIISDNNDENQDWIAIDGNSSGEIVTTWVSDLEYPTIDEIYYKRFVRQNVSLSTLDISACQAPYSISFEPIPNAVSYILFIELTASNGSTKTITKRIPSSSVSMNELPIELEKYKINIRIAAIFLDENADEIVGEFSDKREFILDCDENLIEPPAVESRTVSNFDLEVSPNPVSNELTVQFNSETSAITQFEIVDLNGKILLSQNRTLQKGQNVESINIANLPKGQYFLQIQTEEGTQQAKFIKL